MIEIIEFLLIIIGPIAILSFIIFFFISASIIINAEGDDYFIELKKYKLGAPSAFSMLISYMLIFTLNFIEIHLVRNEFKNYLIKEDYEIIVENKRLDSLGFYLKQITKVSNQRNTSKAKIKLFIIKDTDSLPVRLERSLISDSKYWVYFEKYRTTRMKCIGEINTHLLSEY